MAVSLFLLGILFAVYASFYLQPPVPSAKDILEILTVLNRDHGKTVVMVTHDPGAAKYAQVVRHLEKGDLLLEGQLPEA